MKKVYFKKAVGILCALTLCLTSILAVPIPASAEGSTELVRIDFSADAYGAARVNSASNTAGISWFSGDTFWKRVWGDRTGSSGSGNIALKHGSTNWPRYFTLGKYADVKASDPLTLEAGKYNVSLDYLPDLDTKAGGISVCLSKAYNATTDVICKGTETFDAQPASMVAHKASFDFVLTDNEYAAGYRYVMILVAPKVTGASDRIILWMDNIVVSKSAKKENTTKISFEHGNGYHVYMDSTGTWRVKDLKTGLYDYNEYYDEESTGISAWYKVTDPADSGNTCMRGIIGGNSDSHFAVTLTESSTEGYKLYENTNYYVTYRYKTVGTGTAIGTNIRGSKRASVGTYIDGGKSSAYAVKALSLTGGEWKTAAFSFSVPAGNAATWPYLVFAFGGQAASEDLLLYIDDIIIREYDTTAPAYLTTYNNNGELTEKAQTIGETLITPDSFAGAVFKGWYNKDFSVPYTRVPSENVTLYAKYDADILTFENGGYYDPFHHLGSSISNFSIVTDPTNPFNSVLMADLQGNGANNNMGLGASSYLDEPNAGYKLTTGNTYTVTFRYYATNLNSKGVLISLRGKERGYIGISGGTSGLLGSLTVKSNSSEWQTATLSFTYTDNKPYLSLLAYDLSGDSASASAVVYFDDIVIKETKAAEVIEPAIISIGSYNIASHTPDIVIPTKNFSYLATMQLEELIDVVEAKTGAELSIVKEGSASPANTEIVVGDVSRNIVASDSLNEDRYAIQFADGKVYINGGSAHALAMGISEFAKMVKGATGSVSFTSADNVIDNYSEVISDYDSSSYYTPSFAEDFNADSINTDIWHVMGTTESNQEATEGYFGKTSIRSADHTNIEDGCLVIDAAYDGNYFYGGKIISESKLLYKYGYIETSAILPYGAGLWSALWCGSRENAGYYTSEFDINECVGDNKIDGVVHAWPTAAGRDANKEHTVCGTDSLTDSSFSSEFHTYGLLWTQEKLQFTCDGEVFYTYNITTDDDIDAFNDYVTIIMSLLVGSTEGDQPDLAASYWNTTNELKVDYVHLYQIDGQYIKYGDEINCPISTFVYSDSDSVTYSVKAGNSVAPTVPTKAGYTFIGWYANGVLQGTNTVTIQDTNTVYTARFTKNTTRGDITGAEVGIDSEDLVALTQILLGLSNDNYDLVAADVNEDNIINILDIICLKKILAQ